MLGSKHFLIIIRGLGILFFGIYAFDLSAQYILERSSSAQLISIGSISTKNNTVTSYAYTINTKVFVFSGGDGGIY
jgi:hypothetical protein